MHKNRKHWLSGTPFYRSWFSMKSRCRNQNDTNYKRYGARGIDFDENWSSFANFYDDMFSTYSEWLTLDRIDNSKWYWKSNCRWSTYKEQARNKRSNVILTIEWATKTVAEWLEFYWLDYRTYYTRLRSWIDPIIAMTTPASERNRLISFGGKSLTLRERSENLGIGYKTLYRRIYIKWYPLKIALTGEKYDGKRVL